MGKDRLGAMWRFGPFSLETLFFDTIPLLATFGTEHHGPNDKQFLYFGTHGSITEITMQPLGLLRTYHA
jgi:hypothetical protein